MKRLSFAIMSHDEVAEFQWLMESLASLDRAAVEIVVVDDHSGPEMRALLTRHADTLAHRALDGDFGAQRNFLKSLCKGDYIFVIDPDEIPTPALLANLFRLCDVMDAHGILACAVPRLNVIHDGPEPLDARGLGLSDADFVGNDPDYQTRILRNVPAIRWENRIHERLVGMDSIYQLAPTFDHALLHVKARQRQIDQNAFYDLVDRYSIRQIAKRLGLRPLAVALGILKDPVRVPFSLVSHPLEPESIGSVPRAGGNRTSPRTGEIAEGGTARLSKLADNASDRNTVLEYPGGWTVPRGPT